MRFSSIAVNYFFHYNSSTTVKILRQLRIDYDSKLFDFADNDELEEYISGTVDKLMNIAKQHGRKFCWSSIKASELKNGRVLVVGHFPPNGQNLHLHVYYPLSSPDSIHLPIHMRMKQRILFQQMQLHMYSSKKQL